MVDEQAGRDARVVGKKPRRMPPAAIFAVGLVAAGAIALGLLKPGTRTRPLTGAQPAPAAVGLSAPEVDLDATRLRTSLAAALLARAREPDQQSAEREPGEDLPLAELTVEDYVRKVQAEPREEAWAAPTQQLFEEDLRSKAESLNFRIRRVECRSKSCLAELDFSSLRSASEGFKAMLGPPNRPDCHERFLLPPEGDSDKPALAFMILDCSERREQAAARAAPPLGAAQ